MTFGLGVIIWFGLLLLAAAFEPINDNPFVVIVGSLALVLPALMIFSIIAGTFGYHPW